MFKWVSLINLSNSEVEYCFLDSAKGFITLNDTRRNGAVIDKGYFYPKSAFSFSYRYCAKSPSHASQDIMEYQAPAEKCYDAAQVLGYQPYSQYRKLISVGL